MKKFIAVLLTLSMLFACGAALAENVMTHADYVAAAIDDEIVVETYVQAKQSWWDNKGTFYCQSEDGAYFLYEMPCSEEDYNKLVPGTKIKVTGYKTAWAGEVEIVDATYEILEGSFIAEAADLTALLGTDELINHQNEFVVFKGMTIEAVEYKNGQPGDDIYVTVSKDGQSYTTTDQKSILSFCETAIANNTSDAEPCAFLLQYAKAAAAYKEVEGVELSAAAQSIIDGSSLKDALPGEAIRERENG